MQRQLNEPRTANRVLKEAKSLLEWATRPADQVRV